MADNINPGTVIFCADRERLAGFYQAMTGFEARYVDDVVIVLGSDAFEIVIHSLAGEPVSTDPLRPRNDCYIKPFFPVASLSEAREKAAVLGGQLQPETQEWMGRDFRACEAIDPEGNIIQFREAVPPDMVAS